ncbi:MAG: nucleotidyl transferase AbiEii/AbiGii toxin family protein, partial [Verrucomicrobiota bacterium]|nr:nucleotidyl transferase AbiEii/AbiGii toxin family protein [Verrucomicrobiota bacterium]
LEAVLQEIGNESRFENFEPDRRDPDRLPKRSHYKFSYTSAVNGRPADILLDVMEEECLYPETTSTPVATSFAIPENHFEVQTPTLENLTADKLTAFAPNTIGVKYSTSSSLKILKHCADVGVLFDHCENMEELHAAYEAIWPVENSYRENAFSREQVLDDTIEAARLIGMLDLKGCPNSPEIEILRTGIKQLDSHIVGTRFSLNEAKVCAAKAAWLATALKISHILTAAPRYSIEELQELAGTPLQNEFAPLNRLKGGAPEAYYFWLKISQLSAI